MGTIQLTMVDSNKKENSKHEEGHGMYTIVLLSLMYKPSSDKLLLLPYLIIPVTL